MNSVRWQKSLAEGFGSVTELLEHLELPLNLGDINAQQQFRTRVPRGFAARMTKGDPKDPLLLQVLATSAELSKKQGYTIDPLEEAQANALPGLIHKYPGRVLVILTGACAINCRYCFRRHFPYAENAMSAAHWEDILTYVRTDPSLTEIIFSGGDPLLASNSVFQRILPQLEAISHLKTLRIHSRLPIVLPERIEEQFLDLMEPIRLNKVMVVHSNHPKELDKSVVAAVKRLKEAGFWVLNQSVLLKGINDDAAILASLSEQLFKVGILPYYLHLLDKVTGIAHFDVPLEEALQIYRLLQEKVSGYLLPKLVRETPFKKHKVIQV
ncbi:MAG: EF-P beta-lysylation protein EpmB [Legionella sp.]|nr:EF-P beta-lysylation protein EpmB [Legionella sp.]